MNQQPIRSQLKQRQTNQVRDSRIFTVLIASFFLVAALFVIVLALSLLGVLKPSNSAVDKKASSTPTMQALTILETAQPAALTPEATPEETTVPTEQPSDGNTVCVYQVQSGDYMNLILNGFDLEYTAGDVYYTRECINKGGQLTCGAREKLENVRLIYPGQWIEIPKLKQAACEKGSGKMGAAQ